MKIIVLLFCLALAAPAAIVSRSPGYFTVDTLGERPTTAVSGAIYYVAENDLSYIVVNPFLTNAQFYRIGNLGSGTPNATNYLRGDATWAALPSGLSGTNGLNGSSGTNGINGSSGTNGINGISGVNGTNGLPGAAGASGTNGVNGTAGVSGTNGLNGAQGIQGLAGTNGVNGTAGINGTNGLNADTNIVATKQYGTLTLTNLSGTGALTNASTFQPANATLTNLAGTGALTNAATFQPANVTLTNLSGTGALTNGTTITNFIQFAHDTNAMQTTGMSALTNTGAALTNFANTKQQGSAALTNLSSNPNAATNILSGGYPVTVTSNNAGGWTITGIDSTPSENWLTNAVNTNRAGWINASNFISGRSNSLNGLNTFLLATNANALGVSNILITPSMQFVDLYTTNSLAWTNFSGFTTGTAGRVEFRVIPQLINRTNLWPVIGNSSGVRVHTNDLSTLWANFTNGQEYEVRFTWRGTNLWIENRRFSP